MKERKIPDPEDSWAQVELYRWQYGELPHNEDFRPLDLPVALKNMGEALSSKNQSDWPSPFNIAAVLKYIAKKL